MDPVSGFFRVGDCGDLEQGGKEFILMGVHFISAMQGFIMETNDSSRVKGREYSSS